MCGNFRNENKSVIHRCHFVTNKLNFPISIHSVSFFSFSSSSSFVCCLRFLQLRIDSNDDNATEEKPSKKTKKNRPSCLVLSAYSFIEIVCVNASVSECVCVRARPHSTTSANLILENNKRKKGNEVWEMLGSFLRDGILHNSYSQSSGTPCHIFSIWMLLNVVEGIYCVRFGAQINREQHSKMSVHEQQWERKKLSSSIKLMWKMWENWDVQHSKLKKCIEKLPQEKLKEKWMKKYLQFQDILKFLFDLPLAEAQAARKIRAATLLNQNEEAIMWNETNFRCEWHFALLFFPSLLLFFINFAVISFWWVVWMSMNNFRIISSIMHNMIFERAVVWKSASVGPVRGKEIQIHLRKLFLPTT